MRNRFAKRPRRSAALWALAFALATVGDVGTAGAQNAADEEVPFDTRMLRQFLKDLGLRRDGESIEYRERAPLVVPPSRDLPPPRSEAAVTDNPAWPKDPDVKQRRDAANLKRSRPTRTAAEAMEAEARPLPRSELDRGRVATGAAQGSNSPEDGARPMQPAELGHKGLFSLFAPSRPETATFAGEPVRDSLTEPPPGYQTPSPNQPYGVGAGWRTGEKPKAATVEDRASGETR